MPKIKSIRPAVRVLVDAYAKARVEAKAAEKTEQALREQILQQLEAHGTNRLTGNVYEIDRSTSSREILDSKAVRLLLTPEQIKRVTKTSLATTLSVREVNEVIVRSVA